MCTITLWYRVSPMEGGGLLLAKVTPTKINGLLQIILTGMIGILINCLHLPHPRVVDQIIQQMHIRMIQVIIQILMVINHITPLSFNNVHSRPVIPSCPNMMARPLESL